MIRASLKNPYLVVVAALGILVLGLYTFRRIPADLLPEFEASAVQIVCFYPGMPPEVMEKDIMSRLQRWTGQSVGISHQEAKAMQGVCIVKDFFREGISMDTAMSQVTSYAMSDMFYLPPGTIPPMIMPFDPTAINYGSDYTEGNAWQYSWFMPHDQGGLFRLLGGDAKAVAKLDAMFDYDNSQIDYSHAEDIAGLIGQYIHGNEPSHHVAYLYNYAGQPWRTQERLKQIVESQYKPTPDGLAGNDDLGQMSAWLVFTALGFYPVAPGSNEYVIGRPFVDHAAINLPNGKRFEMTTLKSSC